MLFYFLEKIYYIPTIWLNVLYILNFQTDFLENSLL